MEPRDHASIASAKGAVEGLTRSLAVELTPHIRVNAIAPPLTERQPNHWAACWNR